MDKYKTSEMGKSLKKVFYNKITVDDSVMIVKNFINEIFNKKEVPIEKDMDNGFYGDIIGKCPKCGMDVKKNRYGYGCTGYKNGCNFKINGIICKRIISKSNAIKLLKEGKTSKIEGFISKNGKKFDAYLIIKDNSIEFSFD